MFRWFEHRLKPFPPEEPREPPRGLIAFCRHYTRGAWPAIFAMALLTSIIAIVEVSFYAFLGNIVDWLSEHSREDFFAQERSWLIVMALVILVVLPLLALVQSLFLHQTLLGNYPMRIRWNVHRYLLRQSMSFFQNEFSGRVATKLMQTALAVRESVLKVLEVLNFVGVYFLGAMIIAASADVRLMLPLGAWLMGYIALLRYFVPRLRTISEQQADARATMTGRIVDSYTNISTVKLFSHSQREEAYAKDGMQAFLATVYRQMRLVTRFLVCLHLLNGLLLSVVGGVALYLWTGSLISTGAVAAAMGLVLRLSGMSHWIMWEVSNLFENIGTVEDGITSISLPQVVRDQP